MAADMNQKYFHFIIGDDTSIVPRVGDLIDAHTEALTFMFAYLQIKTEKI
jgi:hypothetical protein